VQCFKCKTTFTMFNRRHHCRGCGRIFCHACSSRKSPIPDLHIRRPVRVCDMCFYAAVRRAQQP
jgi:growth factor-regulated tyrosine kinase substrate